jgi:hypothetical protein
MICPHCQQETEPIQVKLPADVIVNGKEFQVVEVKRISKRKQHYDTARAKSMSTLSVPVVYIREAK